MPKCREAANSDLLHGAHIGCVATIQRALKDGANINTTDDRGTHALHKTCQFGEVKATMALLDAGADVNKLNQKNQTPLDLAIRTCTQSIQNALIARGAKTGKELGVVHAPSF